MLDYIMLTGTIIAICSFFIGIMFCNKRKILKTFISPILLLAVVFTVFLAYLQIKIPLGYNREQITDQEVFLLR